MAINKLDENSIDKKTEQGKYHDGGGLYLIVKPSGARSWVLRYSGKKVGKSGYREMGLGSCEDYTLDDVREKARLCRQQVDQGDDPRENRNEDREAKKTERAKRVTVAAAYDAFVKSMERKVKSGRMAKRTMEHRKSACNRYIIPAIGKMLMDTVEGVHAKPIIEAVAEIKPGMARAVENVGRLLFKRGQQEGWYPDNKILPFSRKGAVGLVWEEIEEKPPKHHAGLPAVEIPLFMQRLRTPEGGGTGLLLAEAAELVELDRSEVIRAVHRGELPAHRGPTGGKGYTSPWCVWPNDLYKWRPRVGQPLQRNPISVASRCLQYTILTAGRPEMVRFMAWDDYDRTGEEVYNWTKGHVKAAGHFWIIPPHKHKNGRRTGKPLIIPLSSASVQILKEQERFQGSDVGVRSQFVFAHGRALTSKGLFDGKPFGEAAVRNIFAETIDRPGLTVYGFRGSYCTWAYEQLKYNVDAIEMSMGHERRIIKTSQGPRIDKTREAYDFAELLPERRRLAEDWARFCTSPAPIPSEVIVPSEKLTERRRLKNA
jgi:hypothetical protein